MDGNGRWAKERNKPRYLGHRAGARAVEKAIEIASKLKIQVLSLFAFSSENWQRPKEEVQYLMRLFSIILKSKVKKLHKNNVQFRVIGDVHRFSEKIRSNIIAAERLTKKNTGLKLVIAANYGGRWDIVQAARKLANKAVEKKINPNDISEEVFDEHLMLADLPPPDLFIRTSGEQRISNFFLWQLAYSELYFTKAYWPDFDEEAFLKALSDFKQRKRRFGKIDEQDGVRKC